MRELYRSRRRGLYRRNLNKVLDRLQMDYYQSVHLRFGYIVKSDRYDAVFSGDKYRLLEDEMHVYSIMKYIQKVVRSMENAKGFGYGSVWHGVENPLYFIEELDGVLDLLAGLIKTLSRDVKAAARLGLDVSEVEEMLFALRKFKPKYRSFHKEFVQTFGRFGR